MSFVELGHTLGHALAALAAGVLMLLSPLLSLLSGTTTVQIAPPAEERVENTPPLAATATTSSIAIATTTPKKTVTPAPKKQAAPISAPTSTTPAPTLPALDPTVLNTQTRASLVNILCLTDTSVVHPISASGVFVDSRGVILTNAHVGQFFLLADYPAPGSVNCLVRTGSPAQAMYHATLLYLPPAWINDNASQLVAQEAKGTGENDYAFLIVTSAVGSNPLPASFPSISMTSNEPTLGDSAFLAAYPAGFLDGQTIEKSLYIASAYAAVDQLFTFGSARDIDLISVGGTIVSQGGSSGGAVVRTTDGQLEGIISTDTTADTTAARDLRAITLAHINRSLATFGKGGIVQLLSQNLVQEAAEFQSKIAPAEKAALVSVLEHH